MTDNTEIYSFDDSYIGVLRDSGRSLDPDTRIIQRPSNVPTWAWYSMASEFCLFLNSGDYDG